MGEAISDLRTQCIRDSDTERIYSLLDVLAQIKPIRLADPYTA